MSIKLQLYQQCLQKITAKIKASNKAFESLLQSLLSETKSSAGDKHETGRAMLQIEIEKAGNQLHALQEMKLVLQKITPEKTSEKAYLGSVIYTNRAHYYLSISAGQLEIEETVFFAVSAASPIGQLLLGKQKNDQFYFGGNNFKILSVL